MDILSTKAYLITEKDEVREISPKNGKYFNLVEAQKLVDGYIEVVYLTDEQIMIINEDGKYGKGENRKATEIAHKHKAIMYFDFIAGDAILCPSSMLR